MKAKGIVMVLLSIAVVLGAVNSSLALTGASSGGIEAVINELVDPKAGGTKVFGTLSIGYGATDGCCTLDPFDPLKCLDPQVDMLYNMRVTKGNASYPFSGAAKGVCYADGSGQGQAIAAFISQTVIPVVFQTSPVTPSFRNVWFLKSVKNIVTPEIPPAYTSGNIWCCGTYPSEVFDFIMMDIEIAVP